MKLTSLLAPLWRLWPLVRSCFLASVRLEPNRAVYPPGNGALIHLARCLLFRERRKRLIMSCLGARWLVSSLALLGLIENGLSVGGSVCQQHYVQLIGHQSRLKRKNRGALDGFPRGGTRRPRRPALQVGCSMVRSFVEN